MMKKPTAVILSLMILISVLCSCTGKTESPSEAETSSTTEETQSANISEAEINNGYETVRNEKLNKLYDMVYRAEQGISGFSDTGKEGLAGAEAAAAAGNTLDTIAYTEEDISGDGVPELLIGLLNTEDEIHTGTEIIEIFSYTESGIRSLFDGDDRNRCFIKDSGKLLKISSTNSRDYHIGIFSVSADGSELKCEQNYSSFPSDYFTDDGDSRRIRCYAGREFACIDPKETDEITEEEFKKFETEAYTGEKALELKPLLHLGIPQIRLDYLKDIGAKPERAEEYTVEDSEYTEKIFFSCDETIKELTLLSLAFTDMGNNGLGRFDITEVKTFNDLENGLVAGVVFYGDIPNNGFSVTDKFGNKLYFGISQSGYDGSLEVGRFIPNQPGTR